MNSTIKLMIKKIWYLNFLDNNIINILQERKKDKTKIRIKKLLDRIESDYKLKLD